MDKTIPLSALIRLGAGQSGQCFSTIKDSKNNTCAIGAAYLGKFGSFATEPSFIETGDAVKEINHPSFEAKVTDPISKAEVSSVGDLILKLNDSAKWSREQIADWLESKGL